MVDRLGQFITIGVAFVVVMVVVGVLCRWFARRGRMFRAVEWVLVLALAWFRGLLTGY